VPSGKLRLVDPTARERVPGKSLATQNKILFEGMTTGVIAASLLLPADCYPIAVCLSPLAAHKSQLGVKLNSHQSTTVQKISRGLR
jgi:hypothetical protein